MFAIFTTLALYRFSGSHTWDEAPTEEESRAQNVQTKSLSWNPRLLNEVVQETRPVLVEVPAAETSQALVTPPPIASISRPVQKAPPELHTSSKPHTPSESVSLAEPTHTEIQNSADTPKVMIPDQGDVIAEHGEGRVEVSPLPSNVKPIYWKKLPEHFPIPSESTIQLPTGSSKPIPKIQYAFTEESAESKADREGKLRVIKDAFTNAWSGYKEHAWLQDELSPVSGGFRNPFAGWGATLVDSLDTLWIMGLKTEFEEAVQAVKKIDFTTSPRGDIPLFETTIRYLGGLIAAYDISGQKYETLLKKAVELAEILMGAFDTPNRMPLTYYFWRPTFASQPHRAGGRVVLAEIGSLSVEFTRLAQLTGEPKYYDAIARITDALEQFQNQTRLPGMWPTYLDASGCKKPDYSKPVEAPETHGLVDNQPLHFKEENPEAKEEILLKLPKPITFIAGEPGKGRIQNWDNATIVGDLMKEDTGSLSKVKRQLEVPNAALTESTVPSTVMDNLPSATPSALELPQCAEQGFAEVSEYIIESYTLGGMSDSTYEYLPKQYLLLGGLADQYRTMYEASMDVVKEHLIFRPMLPGNEDILFSGALNVPAPSEDDKVGELEAENAHLTCFAGGMLGMGAKIFGREEDLEIAKKLTEGCVWSYKVTTTGIMPESFIGVPCDSMTHCEWNETKWWDAIDPWAESRLTSYEQQLQTYNADLASASASFAAAMAAATAAPSETVVEQPKATPTTPTIELQKRQLEMSGTDEPPSRIVNLNEEPKVSEMPTPTLPSFPVLYSPKPPLSHEEYVKNRIQEERLPEGFVSIRSKKYILRPEAIESVWYMYRITGDTHWREVGWDMFTAIKTHTSTTYGNSAIDDVTKMAPELLDEMESFWLAETLKYFYLLFAEESLVSLDEWVLNTEAHPFRRPR